MTFYNYRYHEENGDKEIVVTPWEDDSTALGSGREIRFLKPVAIPGMPYARAKKVSLFLELIKLNELWILNLQYNII